ncbi:ribosome maturation factor RimP [Candidatus Epulonipiscioides gigas]|nr:ribosome maturation factor RimP [Epulopiscium sp. SCG-C07WGA-EpuloA2]
MNKNNIIEEVTFLITKPLELIGLELIDVEFKKEGANYFLRIYIDKEGGVGIDDCTTASRAIEPILDEKDPIKPAYMLEVSSPGLDRIIKNEKDFIKYAGRLVDIKLYKAVNGKKNYQGELIKKENDIVEIKVEDEIKSFNLKDVATIRLAITF